MPKEKELRIMARERRTKKETTEIKRNHFEDGDFTVTRATELESGSVFFDLELCGIKFYSLTVVNGSKGDFISEANRKGKDGKYYKYYYLNLDDDTSERIIDAVFAKLDDTEKK
jgi:DNA-binding cell septation regulator SpoVG